MTLESPPTIPFEGDELPGDAILDHIEDNTVLESHEVDPYLRDTIYVHHLFRTNRIHELPLPSNHPPDGVSMRAYFAVVLEAVEYGVTIVEIPVRDGYFHTLQITLEGLSLAEAEYQLEQLYSEEFGRDIHKELYATYTITSDIAPDLVYITVDPVLCSHVGDLTTLYRRGYVEIEGREEWDWACDDLEINWGEAFEYMDGTAYQSSGLDNSPDPTADDSDPARRSDEDSDDDPTLEDLYNDLR